MGTRRRRKSRSDCPFFALTPEYQKIVWEEIFLLKYHMQIDIRESYNLPIGLRRWFIKRLEKQLKDESDSYKKSGQ